MASGAIEEFCLLTRRGSIVKLVVEHSKIVGYCVLIYFSIKEEVKFTSKAWRKIRLNDVFTDVMLLFEIFTTDTFLVISLTFLSLIECL